MCRENVIFILDKKGMKGVCHIRPPRHICPPITPDHLNVNCFSFHMCLLWFLFKPRINLSPFTKDFRGEEQHNESID